MSLFRIPTRLYASSVAVFTPNFPKLTAFESTVTSATSNFFSLCSQRASFSSQPKSLNYPLHEAVRDGDVDRVTQLLKTSILNVNDLDDEGELPLTIASKIFSKNEKYPQAMFKVLHDYGACFILDNKMGQTSLELLYKVEQSLQTRVFSVCHSIDGCGIPVARCTNPLKPETKKFDPEFKIKVALEAIQTTASIVDLARKYRVKEWEVIKWRYQARECLGTLFCDKVKNTRIIESTETATTSSDREAFPEASLPSLTFNHQAFVRAIEAVNALAEANKTMFYSRVNEAHEASSTTIIEECLDRNPTKINLAEKFYDAIKHFNEESAISIIDMGISKEEFEQKLDGHRQSCAEYLRCKFEGSFGDERGWWADSDHSGLRRVIERARSAGLISREDRTFDI